MSLSVSLGFSTSIRSLLGSRASLGASLRFLLDVAVPAVPARHSAEQSLGTAWGQVLTSSRSDAKPHAAGGGPILHGDPFAQSMPAGMPCSEQGSAGMGRVSVTADGPVALAACTDVVA